MEILACGLATIIQFVNLIFLSLKLNLLTFCLLSEDEGGYVQFGKQISDALF